MNTRRTFLKTASLAAVTTGLMDWEILARAAASGPLIISDAIIIRVRDRKNGKTDTYLEITSESGLKGYAGPLLKEQVVAYAIALAKGLLPIKPHWLEEPPRPDDLEGYIRLKGETGITLAAGEHWYTRWNVRPFLERKTVSFVQSDPEWCGGITEWLNICALVKGYPGVQVIPHGRHVLAASNCVASQSETLCPMLEFLFQSRAEFQHCQTRPLMAEGGYFAMAEEPGLGPTLDLARLELEPASG